MRKILSVLLVVAVAMMFVVPTFASEGGSSSVSVGGTVKMGLFDRAVGGSSNGSDYLELNKSFGMSFREFVLHVNATLNDMVSFEIANRFSGTTGATPKYGTTVERAPKNAHGEGIGYSGVGHGKAVMMLSLPMEIEVEFGILEPIFTVEYGKQLFWEDNLNGFKFAANDNIGALHGTGVQIYRNFDLGDVALPVYLYALNGTMGDENNQPGVMLHVEPSMGPVTILASFAAERINVTDHDDVEYKEIFAKHKWAAGFMLNLGDFTARGEFVQSKSEGNDIATVGDPIWIDDLAMGYYINVNYKILDWLGVVAHHEKVVEYNSDDDDPSQDNYVANYINAKINLSDSTTLFVGAEIVDYRNNDDSKKLIYTRPNITVRSAF